MYISVELVTEIKSRVDLREIVEEELGRPHERYRKNSRWRCPFHQGDNPTAFSVAEDFFFCWVCEEKGDLLTWLMERYQLTFQVAVGQAAARAGVPFAQKAGPLPPRQPRPIRPPEPPPVAPPEPDWQQARHHYVMRCQAWLWSEANQAALAYLLQQRGLTEQTIRQAVLGYDPGRKIIVIPWYVKRELWRVGARSLAIDSDKAPRFPGFKPALYQADQLAPDKPAVLVEGEFDALSISQVLGQEVVAAVATGATTGARQTRWVAQLAQLPRVLVAFDYDRAGEQAARWWLKSLANAERWRPVMFKDANEMLTGGYCLRRWLSPGLGLEMESLAKPEPEPERERASVWGRWFGNGN